MNHENDGWGRRDTNAAPPGYSPRPSPRNGGHPPPPYSSYGSYSSMSNHHSYHHNQQQQQWRPNARDAHSFGPGYPNDRNDDRRPLCRFFTNGFCRDGDKCRFRHEQHRHSSPSAHYGPPDGHRRYEANREAERHHGPVGSDNQSSNSDRAIGGVDEFGRRTSAKSGGGRSDGVTKPHTHQFVRSDSNRSVGSNKVVGGDDAASHASNSDASPDADISSKFWSKIKLNEKPVKKSPQKPASKPNVNAENEPKKTIKWGSNSTQPIRTKNFCKIPGHDHLWKDCPQNKYSKNYKAKPSAPVLTAAESNAMCRAALGNATAAINNNTSSSAARLDSVVDNSDIPSAAPPNTLAMSINSLNRPALKNNTLKQPPTVVASKAAASAQAKSGSASLAAAIPRRNSTAIKLVRNKSSELQRKSSHIRETAASKLKAAGLQLQTPTVQNTQKKTFVPRSQRGLAKRPSPDQPSPTSKRRKLQSLSNPLTSPPGQHRMSCKNGQWKKVNVPVAPSGNDAIAITKHKSSRLLAKKNNPFDVLDEENHDDNEKDDASVEDHDGTNIDFDNGVESDSANKQLPLNESSKSVAQPDRDRSPEVICLDSSSEDEGNVDEAENKSQKLKPVSEPNHDIEETIDESQIPSGTSQSSEKKNGKTADSNVDMPTQNDLASHNDESDKKELHVEEDEAMEESSLSHINDQSFDEEREKTHTEEDSPTLENSTPHDVNKSSDEEVDTINIDDAPIDKHPSSYPDERSTTKLSGITVQQHEAFTDAQIDEMEYDLLDWIECSTITLDPRNTGPVDDESSVPNRSCCESSDDEHEVDYPTTTLSEKSARNSPHEPTSRSSSRNSKNLSIDTSLKLSQRSDGSSVTLSPPGDDTDIVNDTTLHPPIEYAENNFTEFYTCNYCQRVFNCFKAAADHETKCAFEVVNAKVFDDPVNLCRYMNDFNNTDACHYRPRISRSTGGDDIPLAQSKADSSAAQLLGAKVKNEDWDAKFEAIKKFHSENGHLKLPEGFTSNDLDNLDQWFSRQIHRLRTDKLRANRAKRIKKLLGEDAPPPQQQPSTKAESNICESKTSKSKTKVEKKTWNKRYNAVRKFSNDNGHLNLPDEDDGLGNLHKWLKAQKKKLSTGKLNRKQATKMKKLLGLEGDIGLMQSVSHLCSTDLQSGFPKQKLVVIDTVTGEIQVPDLSSLNGMIALTNLFLNVVAVTRNIASVSNRSSSIKHCWFW